MRCHGCKLPIKAAHSRKAKYVKDEKGRVVRAYHSKCFFLEERRTEAKHGSHPNGEYLVAPSAYDMRTGVGVRRKDDVTTDEAEAVRKRQAEIDEQEALEKRPEAWADWRDPASLEI